MHENNKIQAGFIILTEGGDVHNKPTYRVAVQPENIISIAARSGWSRCNAKVYMKSGCDVDTIETFDEIMQLIEECNKQRNTNSNSNYE